MSRGSATTSAAQRVDRQQRLRDRIAELEAALVVEEANADDAQDAFALADDRLADRRRELRAAESVHEDASSRLSAATTTRDTVRADLRSTRRRLEMAELVRQARG